MATRTELVEALALVFTESSLSIVVQTGPPIGVE